jgi:hypothetical protein
MCYALFASTRSALELAESSPTANEVRVLAKCFF